MTEMYFISFSMKNRGGVLVAYLLFYLVSFIVRPYLSPKRIIIPRTMKIRLKLKKDNIIKAAKGAKE